jgi:hypothetical protein
MMKATTTTTSQTLATWEGEDAETLAAALREIADLIEVRGRATNVTVWRDYDGTAHPPLLRAQIKWADNNVVD